LAEEVQDLADGGGVIGGGLAEEHDVVSVERHFWDAAAGVELFEDTEGGHTPDQWAASTKSCGDSGSPWRRLRRCQIGGLGSPLINTWVLAELRRSASQSKNLSLKPAEDLKEEGPGDGVEGAGKIQLQEHSGLAELV
jgi:hypothetical protein